MTIGVGGVGILGGILVQLVIAILSIRIITIRI